MVAKHKLPDRAGAKIRDAGVEHRPAVAVRQQVDVDVIEGKRKGEPQPSDSRSNINQFTSLRRYRLGEDEFGGLRACGHVWTLRGGSGGGNGGKRR